jgi:hypothetical protein
MQEQKKANRGKARKEEINGGITIRKMEKKRNEMKLCSKKSNPRKTKVFINNIEIVDTVN